MKKQASILLVAALALPLTACMQHTYTLGVGAPGGEIVYKNWHHHWLFGLIRPRTQRNLDVDALCPSGNAVIHQEASFANGIVDLLTTFIYTPTTVTVTCDAGDDDDAVAVLELSAEDAEEIARDPRFHEMVRQLAPERLPELEEALATR